MKDPTILAVFGINIVATVVSFFSVSMNAKLPDVYLASVGGLWMKHQMTQSQKDNDDDL